jgi:hypothetical protein
MYINKRRLIVVYADDGLHLADLLGQTPPTNLTAIIGYVG